MLTIQVGRPQGGGYKENEKSTIAEAIVVNLPISLTPGFSPVYLLNIARTASAVFARW